MRSLLVFLFSTVVIICLNVKNWVLKSTKGAYRNSLADGIRDYFSGDQKGPTGMYHIYMAILSLPRTPEIMLPCSKGGGILTT